MKALALLPCKHLSDIKLGQLLSRSQPAVKVLLLLLSGVKGFFPPRNRTRITVNLNAQENVGSRRLSVEVQLKLHFFYCKSVSGAL